VTSTLIVVFDLTFLVWQGSFDVYQLTKHGIRFLVFIIIIIIIIIIIQLLLLFNYVLLFLFFYSAANKLDYL